MVLPLFEDLFGIKMPRLHLSCTSAAAQIGCAGAKARFCLRRYCFKSSSILHSTFYILHFIFPRAGAYSCLPPRGKVSRSDGRGAFAYFLSSRALVEGSCLERKSRSEHGTLAFSLGGRCHEVTEEGCSLTSCHPER